MEGGKRHVDRGKEERQEGQGVTLTRRRPSERSAFSAFLFGGGLPFQFSGKTEKVDWNQRKGEIPMQQSKGRGGINEGRKSGQ